MNTSDTNTLERQKIDWQHFDGSTGSALVSERQYLEGEYTFGPSGKCRVTVEFTGLVIPGLTGKVGSYSFPYEEWLWLFAYDAGGWSPPDDIGPNMTFQIHSYGPFLLDQGGGMPTINAHYFQAGEGEIGGGVSSVDILNMPADIAQEVFTLTVEITRNVAPDQGFGATINLGSPNITLIADSGMGFGSTRNPAPASFKFAFGDRCIPFGIQRGISNVTVTKFFCEDVA